MKKVAFSSAFAFAFAIGVVPVQAASISKTQEKAVGLMAQAYCAHRLYEQPASVVAQKIDYFLNAYNEGTELKNWMLSPQVTRVASVLSMGMNSNCSSFDLKSPQVKEGFQLMNSLKRNY